MIPTTTTTSTTPASIAMEVESMESITADNKNSIWRRQTSDTSSASSTPTGFRNHAKTFKAEVPILPVRVSSFGSDAFSVCTQEFPDLSMCSSSSYSETNSTNPETASSSHIRNVNLYDLIDEEFVVNCGASLANRKAERGSSNSSNAAGASKPGHRRKKSILDMIDGIVSSDDESVSVMTMRSYPRGVYVVPPAERETIATGNTVAFVSAEAYKQW